jgi:large repetitive protein
VAAAVRIAALVAMAGIALAAAGGLASFGAEGAQRAPPGPPTLTGTDPTSPANDNSPRVQGTADAASTVRLYTSADCSGPAAATGTAADFRSAGLPVSVQDDSITRYRATSTDADGNASACSSSSIVYTEDSTSPPPPRLTASVPGSPANQNAPKLKGTAAAKPWFLYVTPSAPHAPFTPEPKYVDAPVPPFSANPAFLETDRRDKPPARLQPTMDPTAALNHRIAQLRTLKSADDLVSKLFSTLAKVGEANNTLAFFVSDNGYLWGEHALEGKRYPYTHSIGVPFFMRWPARIAGGGVDQRIVANIDLAPTIMEAAGLERDPAVDGMSLLGSGSRSRLLTEVLRGFPTWASIRTTSYQYIEYYEDDEWSPGLQPIFREYYDLTADPWQLTNALGDSDPSNDPSPQTLQTLQRQLANDLACAGRDGLAGHTACGPPSAAPGPGTQTRPNVLLIVTDDQRPTDTLDVMPRTKELFDDQGMFFPNAFVTTPQCCPSRASILSGRFSHNHGVRDNLQGRFLDQDSTIARRLQESGYRTGIFGKFLNAWALRDDPPHFDQWSIFNDGPYTNFDVNEQGQVKTIPEYITSYVADKAAEFIRQQRDDTGSTIRLYKADTAADCTDANLAATGTAAAFTSPGLPVSVADDSTTRFRAIATDRAGNASGCSASSLDYVEDSTPPPPPTLSGTAPASPANDDTPRVKGAADTDSTVRLYRTTDCSGTPAATGSAAEFAFPGLEATVPDNSTTRFRATATDAAGNTSTCSTSSIVYVEDSVNHSEDLVAPAAPTLTDTDPNSPANFRFPRIKGAAEAGSAVRLYTTADCSGAAIATRPATEFANPGLLVTVPDNSTTRFRATATDAAGNSSGCSSPIVYVEDSTAPPLPRLTDTDPNSPANDNSPAVKGAAEAASTVRIYKAATKNDCTAANLAGTGTAAEFAASGIQVSVPDGSVTSFRATATDRAGNNSGCSLSSKFYVEDSTPPGLPRLTGTAPSSPANDNTPLVKGTAEPSSTVRLYRADTVAGCTDANLVVTGSAADFASPGFAISVVNDSATRLRATATDRAGNPSGCSTSSILYTEDSTAPVAPSVTGTDPDSPANDNAPRVNGTAEAGSTVRLYTAATAADCTAGNLAATGPAADFAAPGLQILAVDDSTTRLRATATDRAGNASGCSTSSILYTEDSTAPALPGLTATDPDSPANDNSPRVKGTAETGSTVRVYSADSAAGCTAANLVATGAAADFASAGLAISVADDSITRLRATATDRAGNASGCSNDSIVYAEDSTAPNQPTVTDTDPGSPANDNAPRVKGTAEPGATVRLYEAATSADCTPANVAAAGPAGTFNSAGIQVSVADDSSTRFRATATDAAGNASACSASSTLYNEDSTPPAQPTLADTTPGSPANDNTPNVSGDAEAGSTVRLYRATTGSDCTPANLAATGSAGELASPGISVSVADDSTTTLRATATDRAGNASGCSASSIAYVEDSTPPAQPTLTATDPDSPANDNSPTLKGTAAAGSTVRIYSADTAAECTPANLSATGTAADFTSAGIQMAVADDSTTRFRATATDQAGNASACSASSIVYVEDSTAPDPPSSSDTDPDSPANDNGPRVKGAAEAGSTVRLYSAATAADCTPGNLEVTGTAAAFGAPGFQVTVANDSTTRFRATATDQAGNASGCSASSIVYVEDSTPPAQPTLTDTDPDSPANDNSPLVKGAAESNSTVRLYRANTAADCTFANLAVAATAAEFASPGLAVSAPADSTTRFRATSTDQAGNTSACSSSSIVYVEDSTPPGDPTVTDTDPNSPANDNSPSVKGTADAGSTVRIYRADTAADCTPANLAASGGAPVFASPGLQVAVNDDSTTRFRATATDQAGNTSACSASSIVYVEDSTPPAQPTLTDTDPDSPANDNSPTVKGTADPGSTVRVYKAATSADCTAGNLAATGTAANFNSTGLAVSVSNDTTTTFRATATDQVGNVSACSANSIVYVEDSTVPAQATLTDTDPNSPSNDNSPAVKGTAEPGSTVRLYRASTTGDCAFANLVAAATASDFASPGITASVSANSTTRFRATVTDQAGNTTACSTSSIVYVEDSTTPALATLTDTDPNSPANDNSPRVKGTAESGSTVRIYRAATATDCTPANLLASGTAAAFASPGIASPVPDNSTTRFRATVTDQAGNASACSSSSIVYVEDSTPPVEPTLTDTNPRSPSNENQPRVRGMAEAGTTVRIYKAPTTADCTAANLLATGSANNFTSPGLRVSVQDNSTTRFRATASDAVGNASACSASSVVYVENSG